MKNSKTVVGLLILLLAVIGLAILGKLTAEAVDALKWIGTSYMTVRIVANHSENKYRNGCDENR